MNITDRGNASTLIAALDKVGAKAPAAVTESYATTTRVSQAVRAIGVRPETIYPAVAAALERGDDPTTDTEVTRILVSGMISNQGVQTGVEDIAFTWFREVCADQSDQIVLALRKPFDQAATTLTTAHQSLGDVPLEDSDTILRIGGNAPSQWALAQSAVQTIDTVSRGWFALAAFTGHRTDTIRHQILRITTPTYAQWMSQELEGKHADPWAAILEGLDLALPTFTQYRERVDAIAQGAQQAAAERADDQLHYLTNRRPAARAIG